MINRTREYVRAVDDLLATRPSVGRDPLSSRYDVRAILARIRWEEPRVSPVQPNVVVTCGTVSFAVRATRLPRGWWERLKFAFRPPKAEPVDCNIEGCYYVDTYDVERLETKEAFGKLLMVKRTVTAEKIEARLVSMFTDKEPFPGSPAHKDAAYMRWILGGKGKRPMFEWPVLLAVLP